MPESGTGSAGRDRVDLGYDTDFSSAIRHAFPDLADGDGGNHAGRVRLRNEDRVACRADCGLAVLADGMGGHAGGAEAAWIAVAAWMERMEQGGGSGPSP